MGDILTVPIDLPRHRPFRLVVMMGLTVLLYLAIAAQSGLLGGNGG